MAGTVVLSSQRAEGVIRWARFLATGDSGDGGYPAVSLVSRGVHIDGTIIGVVTNPGATAPTDNWGLTLVDADGIDRLGGVGANRDTSNSEWATVGRTAAPDEELLLTITGNSVNSATIEIVLFWTPSSSAGGSSSEVQVVGALPAGTNAIGKLAANSGVDIGDVDVTTVVPGTGATNLGKAIDSAAGSTDTGVAPVAIRDDTLSSLTPAEGDWAPVRVDANGALWVQLAGALASATDSIAIKPPATQVKKSYNTTSQQTGADVWSPGSGKKIRVTDLIIGTYGTTAGRLILWFGANADTTYSEGTDEALFKASFAPSATAKPGAVVHFSPPYEATTADHELHITTDAALSVDIVVVGYEE